MGGSLSYTEFNFAEYLERYVKRNGISKASISRILGLSYETVRSKFNKNTFTYSEVLYLNAYYKDLHFLDNYKRYLALRNIINDSADEEMY